MTTTTQTRRTFTLYRKEYGDTDSAEYGFGDYANVAYVPLAYTSASSEGEALRKFKRHFGVKRRDPAWSVQPTSDDIERCYWGEAQ